MQLLKNNCQVNVINWTRKLLGLLKTEELIELGLLFLSAHCRCINPIKWLPAKVLKTENVCMCMCVWEREGERGREREREAKACSSRWGSLGYVRRCTDEWITHQSARVMNCVCLVDRCFQEPTFVLPFLSPLLPMLTWPRKKRTFVPGWSQWIIHYNGDANEWQLRPSAIKTHHEKESRGIYKNLN